jgi:integrase/recombinase XerD
MSGQQLSLFDTPDEAQPGQTTAPAQPALHEAAEVNQVDQSRLHVIDENTTLREAMDSYREHMIARQFSPNTVKAFMYDLNIVAKYFTAKKPIGEIAHRDLERFIDWLVNGRGVPCNPKSLARRMTTLKTFFGWLMEIEAIAVDPAAPIVHVQAQTPLPDILYDNEIEAVLAATKQLRAGLSADPGAPPKPDTRPHLLVTLLLATGIKKSECAGVELAHIDRSNPDEPSVWIRYADPRHYHKERKLKLDRAWLKLLDEYLSQYDIRGKLFPWTPRNLEYILADVGQLAGLDKKLSFEMLRWTCAARDKRNGMADETLRRKMGLSQITWREVGEKLAKLTAPAV